VETTGPAEAQGPLDEDTGHPTGDAEEAPSAEEAGEDVRHLLRGALAGDDVPPPDVLGGFQRKLRQRSGGKFYADEWSTAREPPVATYLVTSLLMLVFLLLVFAFLRSLSGEPAAAQGPEPINVVPSPHRGR
jgi:hypothetical protein